MILSARTIKAKLQLSLTGLLLIPLIMILTAYIFNNRRDQIQQIDDLLAQIKLEIARAHTSSKDFLSDEVINDDFYLGKPSSYLLNFIEATNTAENHIQQLESNQVLAGNQVVDSLRTLKKEIARFRMRFDTMTQKVRIRGFRDFGKVGKMRDYIHKIENSGYPINIATMLMIRRHEKDFIIRKEIKYKEKLNDRVKEMINEVSNQKMLESYKKEIIDLLNKYEKSFMDVFEIEKQIGFSNKKGLRSRLSENIQIIDRLTNYISDEIKKKSIRLSNNTKVIFGIVILMCLALFIFFIYQISKFVSTPIATLSSSIREVVKNQFKKGIEVYQPNTKDEIRALSEDFAFMLKNVQDSFDEIQKKSKEVQEQNEAIVSSLRYAQTIQEAILPPTEELNEYFNDHFVIYEPQQMVSGDFYWAYKRKNQLWVAVIDCTGHGVPGAFMSMIGHTLLHEIINQHKIYEPALILEALHLELVEALKQHRSKNSDGMDVCLCHIENGNDKDERIITFAGAKSPLYYTEKGVLQPKISGSRKAIGGVFKTDQRRFENKELKIRKGDTLYLTTDGYVDQNNHLRQRIGSKQFFQLLTDVHEKPFAVQKSELMSHFLAHKGDEPQRDDLTILAVRV